MHVYVHWIAGKLGTEKSGDSSQGSVKVTRFKISKLFIVWAHISKTTDR